MSYSLTHSGKRYVFEKPAPEMIDVEDLAHALSHICRFTGHTERFYSVAQHSVLASLMVPAGDALAGLFHDSPEAYLSDLPRYLKRARNMEGYANYEDLALAAIAAKMGFNLPLPESVKLVDLRLVMTEWRDCFNSRGAACLPEFGQAILPYDWKIFPWNSERAKIEFMMRYRGLIHGNQT